MLKHTQTQTETKTRTTTTKTEKIKKHFLLTHGPLGEVVGGIV